MRSYEHAFGGVPCQEIVQDQDENSPEITLDFDPDALDALANEIGLFSDPELEQPLPMRDGHAVHERATNAAKRELLSLADG